MEFWIWVIIMIVVAIVKGIGKLQSAAEEQPMPSKPKPRPQRPARPRPRPATAPPVATPRAPEGWRIEPEHLREFISQVTRQVQPPPIATAKVRQPPKPERKPERPPPPPAAPEPAVEQKPSRASQWATAFRDKHNLRNIVVAAEIIGPPRAERPY